MRTVRVQRLEYSLDSGGYLTYVFKLLDEKEIEDVGSNYLMVVQRPNWNQPFIEQGTCGYLKYKEIQAGVDTWYNDVCTSSPWCNYLSGKENGKFSTNPYIGNGRHGHVGNQYNWTAAIATRLVIIRKQFQI